MAPPFTLIFTFPLRRLNRTSIFLNLLMCQNKPEISLINVGASVDTSDMKPALDGSDECHDRPCPANNRTALHLAAMCARGDYVEKLPAAGANLNILDN